MSHSVVLSDAPESMCRVQVEVTSSKTFMLEKGVVNLLRTIARHDRWLGVRVARLSGLSLPDAKTLVAGLIND